MTSYRDTSEGPEVAELLYAPNGKSSAAEPLRHAAVAAAIGCGLVFVGVLAGSAPAAALLGVATGVAAVWVFRRASRVPATLFRIAQGEVQLVNGEGQVTRTIALSAIRDVAIDAATLHLVKRDDDESYIVRTDSEVRSRIFLELDAPAAPLPLTSVLVTHASCVEDSGRIRAFLRRQGWLPFDERPPNSV